MVKVDILVECRACRCSSFIVHKDKARIREKDIIEKLKDIIPKHQFKIPIQACHRR